MADPDFRPTETVTPPLGTRTPLVIGALLASAAVEVVMLVLSRTQWAPDAITTQYTGFAGDAGYLPALLMMVLTIRVMMLVVAIIARQSGQATDLLLGLAFILVVTICAFNATLQDQSSQPIDGLLPLSLLDVAATFIGAGFGQMVRTRGRRRRAPGMELIGPLAAPEPADMGPPGIEELREAARQMLAELPEAGERSVLRKQFEAMYSDALTALGEEQRAGLWAIFESDSVS